jgi:putative SOS response-associated peptidase YedK
VLRWNPKTRERSLDQLIWDLLPHDTEDPANALRPIMARAETVAANPIFASAFRDRHAIVPISVYYQRRSVSGSNGLFAISRRDGEMLAIAGLWEVIRWPAG